MTDIFTAPVVTAPETPVEDVVTLADFVGEGKKYKDNDAVAKAILHKDATIIQREKELAGLRAELAARNRLEEIADRLSKAPEPLPPTVTTTDEQGLTKTGMTPEDIAKLVAATVAQERTKDVKAQNQRLVVATLQEKLGDNYPEKLRQTLASIGLTEAEANEVAAKNPKAFFAMVGVNDAPQPAVKTGDTPFAPPRTTASPSFQPNATTKNWDYYEAMRRSPDAKQREKYWSVSVQNEIHKQALSQSDPELFYKR